MRSALVVPTVVMLAVLASCGGDTALAPTAAGHPGQITDIPPEDFANYTKVNLPGSETVVDLNDGGDVIGASATGAVLWHGASHDRTELPIVPVAIANDGTVAGNLDGHAVIWRNGHVTVLDTAPSNARAICRCASETVVGSARVMGAMHAMIWTGGVRIDAGLPASATGAEFTGVANGFVVGNALLPTLNRIFGDTVISQHAFAWSHAAGWKEIDGGQYYSSAVGVSSHGLVALAELRYFITTLVGETYDIPTGRFSERLFGPDPWVLEVVPTAINDSGVMSATNASASSLGLLPLIYQVPGIILPFSGIGDSTTSINSSNVVGGRSGGLPVLWIPNP